MVLLPRGDELVLRLLRRSVRLLLRRRRSFPVIRSQRVLLSRTFVLSDATLNVFQFRNSSVSFYGCLRVVEREHGDELTLRIELVLSRRTPLASLPRRRILPLEPPDLQPRLETFVEERSLPIASRLRLAVDERRLRRRHLCANPRISLELQ